MKKQILLSLAVGMLATPVLAKNNLDLQTADKISCNSGNIGGNLFYDLQGTPKHKGNSVHDMKDVRITKDSISFKYDGVTKRSKLTFDVATETLKTEDSGLAQSSNGFKVYEYTVNFDGYTTYCKVFYK